MIILSKTEARIASRIRSMQRSWCRQRWYLLFGGLLTTAMGVWLLFEIAQRIWEVDRMDGEAVWLCPLAWYMAMQGVMLWVGALTRWRGEPVALLLTKLLDEVGTRCAEEAVSPKQ